MQNVQKIDSFTGEYRFLSNFHPSSVFLDGDLYRSVEHAFQAAKCVDLDMRSKFREPALTAGGAKTVGPEDKTS